MSAPIRSNNATDRNTWDQYPEFFCAILTSPIVDAFDKRWTMWKHGTPEGADYIYNKREKELVAKLKAEFPTLCRQIKVVITSVMFHRTNHRASVKDWCHKHGIYNVDAWRNPSETSDDEPEEVWGYYEIQELNEDLALWNALDGEIIV